MLTVSLQQSFLFSPLECAIESLFFIIHYCHFFLFILFTADAFFNHIIKLTELIESNQVNDMGLRFFLLL